MQTPDGLPMAEVDPLGDSGRRACTHLSTRPSVFVGLTDSLAYRVPYNRPATEGHGHALGHRMEGPIAALACRVPVRGTSGPRCVCADRDYPRVGTHRTRSQCDRTGGVTREAPRDGSGVHTPTVHRQPPCPWVLCLSTRRRLGRLQLWRRLGRSATVSGAAWGGAPRRHTDRFIHLIRRHTGAVHGAGRCTGAGRCREGRCMGRGGAGAGRLGLWELGRWRVLSLRTSCPVACVCGEGPLQPTQH